MMTQNRLKELLHYDPDTGVFTWKYRPTARKSWNTRYANQVAGTVHTAGWQANYVGIRVDGVRHTAHKLAWLYVYGEVQPEGMYLDHVNGDGTDNRISNLRLVTPAQSNRNLPKPKDNKSGVVGVHFDKSRNKWLAHIRSERGFINEGRFQDFFEAVCARKSAENRLGYHVNHGR